MVQLHRLEGFYWVAKTGGYARAARAFPYPLTQPAVHQQVKKLEQELAVELFERIGKDRVVPTPAGRVLERFVAPFFEQLPAVLRAVRGGDGAGELVVYAEPLLLRHLLPAWLKRLQRACPGIQLDVRELADLDVAPLRRGEADLLVCYLPEAPEDIASQQVATLRPFLVLPADHPLVARRRLTPRDLADDPFIAYPPGSVTHELQMQALVQQGVQPPHLIYATSAETILGFVASGLGYSLVPYLDPKGPRAKGVVARPLMQPKIEFPVVVAWRRDAPENRMLDAALEAAPSP